MAASGSVAPFNFSPVHSRQSQNEFPILGQLGSLGFRIPWHVYLSWHKFLRNFLKAILQTIWLQNIASFDLISPLLWMKDECGELLGLPHRRGSWRNGTGRNYVETNGQGPDSESTKFQGWLSQKTKWGAAEERLPWSLRW